MPKTYLMPKRWRLGFSRYVFFMTVVREIRRGENVKDILRMTTLFSPRAFAAAWAQNVKLPLPESKRA